jgi:hypothetical protein
MVLIGTEVDLEQSTPGPEVVLSAEGRRQGTYVEGTNGTGKTNLLKSIVLQDMEAGDGLCFLDPHGDASRELLEMVPESRIDDVIFFDPANIDYPFGLNLLECEDPSNPLLVDRICSEVLLTFKKLFKDSWGPRMEDIIRHTVLTVIATPGSTILDMLILLTDPVKREEYVERVRDPVIRHYWAKTFPTKRGTQDEWVGSTLNKLGRFLTNPVIRNIVAQPKSSFSFRSLMDGGKILIASVSKGLLGEDNAGLLGSVLVGQFLIAALSRADTPAALRRPFHLIVDEYHSFATDSFPTLQSEARKFGIDTIVAHQYRDQLDDLNKGSTLNVGNFIFFRVTGRDAREMALQFDNSPPEPEPELKAAVHRTGRDGVYRTSGDRVLGKGASRTYSDVENETANQLANNSNYHAYCKFVVDGGALREHYVRLPRLYRESNPAVAEEIQRRSDRLGTPRAEVEERIARLWADDDGRTYRMD